MSSDQAKNGEEGRGLADHASAESLARRVVALCVSHCVVLATAESCTGGLVAAALTAVPGSSAVFDRGFVTYSNAAKQDMLGVLPETLRAHGAVSAETAVEMAQGALTRSTARLALSLTGIAGPKGGTPEKPVGLVWCGVAMTGNAPRAERRVFPDDGRDAIRDAAVRTALELAIAALERAQAGEEA